MNNLKKLTITITEFGNDSFADGDQYRETARVLREFARKIEEGYTPLTLLDGNGNISGKVDYKWGK